MEIKGIKMESDIQTKVNFDISRITLYLGDSKKNGSGFNWTGITGAGARISLFYETGDSRKIGFIEYYDPRNLLGLNKDSFDIGYISIDDLARYFIRNKK